MHSFRHTCASLLFSQGRNVKQVQRWLGHHSPSFTLETYVHLMDEGVGGGLALPVGTQVGTSLPSVSPAQPDLAAELAALRSQIAGWDHLHPDPSLRS